MVLVKSLCCARMREEDTTAYNTPGPGPWVVDGACVGVDVNVFFPGAGQRPVEALKICARCVVRVECAEYALETNQHWGVWGGLTERQRFTVKRFRRSGVLHGLDPQRDQSL